jgi:hypothetical protein
MQPQRSSTNATTCTHTETHPVSAAASTTSSRSQSTNHNACLCAAHMHRGPGMQLTRTQPNAPHNTSGTAPHAPRTHTTRCHNIRQQRYKHMGGCMLHAAGFSCSPRHWQQLLQATVHASLLPTCTAEDLACSSPAPSHMHHTTHPGLPRTGDSCHQPGSITPAIPARLHNLSTTSQTPDQTSITPPHPTSPHPPGTLHPHHYHSPHRYGARYRAALTPYLGWGLPHDVGNAHNKHHCYKATHHHHKPPHHNNQVSSVSQPSPCTRPAVPSSHASSSELPAA